MIPIGTKDRSNSSVKNPHMHLLRKAVDREPNGTMDTQNESESKNTNNLIEDLAVWSESTIITGNNQIVPRWAVRGLKQHVCLYTHAH